jgi:ABC-2 type transport system ATP-binding protein
MILKIRDLQKSYKSDLFKKNKKALDGLSLSLEEGDVYGFVGPNGAGKSTTIRTLLGLMKSDSGTLEVLGGSPFDAKIRKKIGYLPEKTWFPDQLTGREILEYHGKLAGLRGISLKNSMDEALQRLSADQAWIDDKIRRYSKGMLQRVGLAQAIISKPELLVLDEPMSGLDPVGRRDVREAILWAHSQGSTVFYSSHVLGDVEEISTQIGICVSGKMVQEGSLDSVLGSRENPGFLITLNGDIEHLPEGIKQRSRGLYYCESSDNKKQLLDIAHNKNIDILKLEQTRESLESILCEEISRNG